MTSRSEPVVAYLDLETWALPNAAALIDMRDVKAPSNYKDPEAIARYVAEEKAKRLSKAALDFDLSRIALAGFQSSEGDEPVIIRMHSPDEEYEGLHRLLDLCNDHVHVTLVGHNLLRYDLPLIDRRAFDFSLRRMTRRRLPRYRAEDYNILDLQELLSEGDPARWRSLDWYCDRYIAGLNATLADPLPNGGADVEAALAAGLWDTVEAHLRADLRRIDALYRRYTGTLIPTALAEVS